METERIEKVKNVVIKNFPEMWPITEACLSVIATLKLKDLTDCVVLILQGAPSSSKTTVLSFFYSNQNYNLIYKSDNFTPRSFLSHLNASLAKLSRIDLLPRIKHKCLITPELATIFGKRKEDLLESLSMLTRVLDGQGLATDSGVAGGRSCTGDYRFNWLGATTPLSNNAWSEIGKLGARFFFWNIEPKVKKSEMLIDEVIKNPKYGKKVSECSTAVHEFLTGLFVKDERFDMEWESTSENNPIYDKLVKLVELVRRLRAPIQKYPHGEDYYNSYSEPLIEESERAISTLYSIARGRAILYGRKYLTEEDIGMIKHIAFSTMPYDRYRYFKLLIDMSGVLDVETIKSKLSCSDGTARNMMDVLRMLGICKIETIEKPDDHAGRPIQKLMLKEEFRWVLGEKF